jgi:hypothetical protein
VAPGISHPALAQEVAQRCRQILDFWHQVEFFIPFDLQQVTEDKEAEWRVREVTEAQLRAMGPSSSDLWRVSRLPKDQRLVGFDLYLGIFDKNELTRASQKLARTTPSEEVEQAERCDLEGLTCCSRVRLDAQGGPLFDEVSVSTVPWALGRLRRSDLQGLAFDAFQEALEHLREDLRAFRARRSCPAPDLRASATPPNQAPVSLTGLELLDLLEVFNAWAGFRPEPTARAIIAIRARTSPLRARDTSEAAAGRDGGQPPKEPPPEADDEESPAPDPEIDILNSFFARDLELVIRALDRGDVSRSLLAYLAPRLDERQRVDLYSEAGRKRILADLEPARLPDGRWPSDPERSLSLMQQFALHNVLDASREEGLFSINGPPGTGKTTLLREIIAENITRRARALAECGDAKQAFASKVTVTFDGSARTCTVAVLKPQLTGFEMVVASSNNAAVENISRDLPKAKSLGEAAPGHGDGKGSPWRPPGGEPRFTYLKPVAHKLAAQAANGSFKRLSPDDTPWGLLSCALGKASNRRSFVHRLRSPGPKPGERQPKNYDPVHHQSIWEWRKSHRGPSFEEARRAFQVADRRVAARRCELVRLAVLASELGGHTPESYAAPRSLALAQAEEARRERQSALDALGRESELCRTQLADLEHARALLRQLRPPWWQRLLRRTARQRYEADLRDNAANQLIWVQRKLEVSVRVSLAEASFEEASEALEVARRALADRQRDWATRQAELAALKSQFPQARQPDGPEDLDGDEPRADDWQIQGVWRDDELNRIRSELFGAALALQQAWLAEVLVKGGGFGSNLVALCHLLSGRRPTDREHAREHALAIWQSLFMLVPVVSSTFASMGSQFRDLGANALGWLFVDEAGQAVPQAAVGALWRARHAVVVGDPLQIEPVFTVPLKLIEALARSSGLSPEAAVEPHRASVQRLADDANPLAVRADRGQGNAPLWIGSPLRVHRRCDEPMFGIANRIAYGGKMVSGLAGRAPALEAYWGDSAWIDVSGCTSHGQVVTEQVELVLRTVVARHRAAGALPPLYVVSPFRKVKAELMSTLSDVGRWKEIAGTTRPLPGKTELRDWCAKRIGTVHTFQGKEESVVLMVLGCDARATGAVTWASSKPNLLNVAVTRAQHRVFIVGDVALWGSKPYFETARSLLPVITGDEFLGRVTGCEVPRLGREG